MKWIIYLFTLLFLNSACFGQDITVDSNGFFLNEAYLGFRLESYSNLAFQTPIFLRYLGKEYKVNRKYKPFTIAIEGSGMILYTDNYAGKKSLNSSEVIGLEYWTIRNSEVGPKFYLFGIDINAKTSYSTVINSRIFGKYIYKLKRKANRDREDNHKVVHAKGFYNSNIDITMNFYSDGQGNYLLGSIFVYW